MVTKEEMVSRIFEVEEKNKTAYLVSQKEMVKFSNDDHDLRIKLQELKFEFDDCYKYKPTIGYEKFAEACTIGTSTIKQILNGKVRISRNNLYLIVIAMKLSIEEANEYFELCGGKLNERSMTDYICIRSLEDGDDVYSFAEQIYQYAEYKIGYMKNPTNMPPRPGQKFPKKKLKILQ